MSAVQFVIIFFYVVSVSYSLPIIATWYCSLTNPQQYGYCGNPNAGWVADCGISIQNPPCSGCGITALNPLLYNNNTNSHTCQWKGVGCGICWKLNGVVLVMVTDCCAGYSNQCSCFDCPTNPSCDWCAKGDNWHFDLDVNSFLKVCGNLDQGHCEIKSAQIVDCPK